MPTMKAPNGIHTSRVIKSGKEEISKHGNIAFAAL